MKKNVLRFIAPLLCGAMIAGSMPEIAHADSCKIVTLGNDLTDAQKQTMLNYFNVSSGQAQIIYVTNDQEQALLGGKIPAEQIGTHTLSCAYVNPTTSGGIKVRTANLTYVTCNMLASTLSTAGITNAEVIAACPFAVSGTGALTGIMIAYEQATGTELSEEKKDLATQEMVDTGKLGDHTTDNTGKPIGRDQAIYVVNQAKIEIIQNGITDEAQIEEIVKNVLEEENYTAVESYLQEIVDLLKQIADQDYNYDDVKDTLDNIDQNIEGTDQEASAESTETTETAESESTDAESTDAESTDADSNEDSIMNEVDESKLGEDVIISDTTDSAIYEETKPEGEENELSGFDGVTSETFETDAADENTGDTAESTDTTTDETNPEDGTTVETEATEAADTETEAAETLEEKLAEMYEQLDDAGKMKYDDAVTFCEGEYLGDTEKLQSVLGTDFTASAAINDTEIAEELKNKVLEVYADLLLNGVDSAKVADSTLYMTAELNQLHNELVVIFGLDTTSAEYDPENDTLANFSEEDRQALFNDTMVFFENVYGEGLPEVIEESFDDMTSVEGIDATEAVQ